MFAGTIEDAAYGYDEILNGDKSKSFVDGDGSVTKCPGWYIVQTFIRIKL